MSTGSVEVIYRGIFQKTLAKNICRGIVFAAKKEGKIGLAFGRYSDSPERNGIPAKQFAVVADEQEEMEEYLSRYEPDNNDVTIAVDDMMCKGVESWAWYGLQPINKLLGAGGTLLVTSIQSPNKLINFITVRERLTTSRSSGPRPVSRGSGCTRTTTPTCACSARSPRSRRTSSASTPCWRRSRTSSRTT